MKTILDIPDNAVHLITRKSIDNNDIISFNILLKEIDKLKPGSRFNIKKLMGDSWKDIKNPKGFGKRVKKHLIKLGYEWGKMNTLIFYTKPFK